MKKYFYTVEFVTNSTISEREQNHLATELHQLVGELEKEVYVNVGHSNPVDISEIEVEQFKKDAGYDE